MMTAPTLRPYQVRTIERAREERRAKRRRILIVAPTGSGKSVVACEMIRVAVEKGARVLVIVHRRELVGQFYVHLQRVGITSGIMRGDDERTDPSASVQVGTIQTLVRRELPTADLVFIDEAHRTPGDSYDRVVSAYPNATICGLTATPCRTDGQPLKEHFDTIVECASYSELIDSGAIVAPVVYVPKRAPDLSKVSKVAGDYNEGQLESAMMAIVGDVAKEWLTHAAEAKTVIFAVTVAHSKEIVQQFRDAGITRIAHLDGTTPEAERAQILCDLEIGKLQIVSNVGVLGEGWDQPSVKCVVMAFATLSLTRMMQVAGRALRPYCRECRFACGVHKSEVPVILDHGGNVERHGLPHEDREWSLDGKAKRKSDARYHTCPACYAYVAVSPKCSVCGHVFVGKPREVKKVDGVLERINAQIAKEQVDPKRDFFDKRVAEAKKKGFAPGWPSVKFKEKFGAWPSWAWSQSVKADHARDADWQIRIGERAKDREKWAAINAEKERASQAQHEASAPVDEPAEFEGAFDGLL
jgi:DNA repair protein RadD